MISDKKVMYKIGTRKEVLLQTRGISGTRLL